MQPVEQVIATGTPWTSGSALPRSPLSARRRRALRVCVVGYGYWGPNLTRNVAEAPELELVALCERDHARAGLFLQRHPGVRVHDDLERMLADPTVDAIVVATPPSTHYAIAAAAIRAGKHVLVEKPLATTAAEAAELIRLAADEDVVLMPGHTFVYSPAVNAVRSMITNDVLGEVYFVTSTRMNLGKYQPDGVIRDLAPHDLSMLVHWLGTSVTQVHAHGRSVFHAAVPETAFIGLGFACGATANVQLSWLAPRKMRQTVVVGSRRMVIYDDTAGDEPVRVFDRGLDVDESAPPTFGQFQLTYRTGDVISPRIEAAEPLALELADFAHCIRTGATPASSAQLGLEVVAAMEAAEASLAAGGAPIVPARFDADGHARGRDAA